MSVKAAFRSPSSSSSNCWLTAVWAETCAVPRAHNSVVDSRRIMARAFQSWSARRQVTREAGAETIDFMKDDVYDRIMELTKGRGADACIDAVGTEAAPMASADS